MNNFKNIKTWIFDMDHTLYPLNKNLQEIYKIKFREYINSSCNIPYDEVDIIGNKMREKYGDARIGFMKEYNFTIDGWKNKMLNVANSHTLQCPLTVELIEKLSGKKVVFTNAGRGITENILEHLGMLNSFDILSTFNEDRNFLAKPDKAVYTHLIESLDINPKTCAFFEDSHINLKPAHELGMTTVLVHGETEGRDYIHHAYPTLLDFLKETNNAI